MKIRRATLADWPRLTEMALQYLADDPYRLLLRADDALVVMLVRTVLEGGACFVAERFVDGGPIVGMIGMVAQEHHISGEPYMRELAWWVDPAYRKSSIGPRLVDAAKQWARENGAHMLELSAPAHSRVGQFLEREGFFPVETAHILRLRDFDGREIHTSQRRSRSAGAGHAPCPEPPAA